LHFFSALSVALRFTKIKGVQNRGWEGEREACREGESFRVIEQVRDRAQAQARKSDSEVESASERERERETETERERDRRDTERTREIGRKREAERK